MGVRPVNIPWLVKVVSGGQTGADIGGLRAARNCGIPTGGFAPKNYLTEDGPNRWLKIRYGLVEAGDYANRTCANVGISDLTIRFAKDFNSPGERCTLKALRQNDKPWIDVPYFGKPFDPKIETVTCVAVGIREIRETSPNDVIINIAGNKESTAPGIGKFVRLFMEQVFEHLSTKN